MNIIFKKAIDKQQKEKQNIITTNKNKKNKATTK